MPNRPVSRLTSDLLLGLGLRGAGAVSSFALAWIMAQMFGATIVGHYQIAFTTAMLLAGIAALGQPVMLVRQIATLTEGDNRSQVAASFRGILRFVTMSGGALAMLAALLSVPLARGLIGEAALTPFVILLAPAVLLLPLVQVQNALLRCLGRVRLSQSLEGVSYTTFATLVLGVLWLQGGTVQPLIAPVALVIGLLLSLLIGRYVTRRELGSWWNSQPPAGIDLAAGGLVAAAPIATLTGNWLILMLIGASLGPADAGVFRIAVMICMLMELINTSFATMAGPHLARAAGAGDTARLRRIILVAGAIGITLAAPLGLLALVAPEWLLGLFGPEFPAGAGALQWIAIGQMINVAAGPVGVALVMQKRERPMLMIEFCATLCGLATTVALLPGWGLAGAGLGVLTAAAIRNLANAALVWFTDAKPPEPAA